MAHTSVPSAPPVTAAPAAGVAVGRPASAARTLAGRVSRGHVVMVVAGVVGVVLSFAALRQHDGNARVVVAAREIHAGERVVAEDFRSVAVTMSAPVLATVVRARDVDAVVGRIAGATVGEGELVSKRVLRPRAARHGLRAMSIPIDPARAVGGRLEAGDRVDVLFAGQQAVSIIVADAEVVAVDARGRGGIGEAASPFTVTIAVSARQSQLVAAAVADGNISLARTTGSESSEGTAPESLDRVGAVDPTAR
jgi:Flp pilus assembly protein CpaB